MIKIFKMRNTLLFIAFACCFIFSCKQAEEQAKVNFNYDQYFGNIDKINNCLGEGEAFDDLGKRMDAGIRVPIDTLSSAFVLKALYYKAQQRQTNAKPKTNGRCADVNIAVKERVLQQLGILADEDAIDALIDLYKDSKLPFLGSDGKSLTRTMIQCGAPILEKLEPVKNQRPEIGHLVIKSLGEN